MTNDKAAAKCGIPKVLVLCALCRNLEAKRLGLDVRIAGMAPEDVSRDVLWQELETMLTELRDAVGRLALAPASQLAEARAKAEVLAIVLRSGEPGDDPILPEDKIRALALSLAEDVAGLPG
jgi:hypothetical protein